MVSELKHQTGPFWLHLEALPYLVACDKTLQDEKKSKEKKKRILVLARLGRIGTKHSNDATHVALPNRSIEGNH